MGSFTRPATSVQSSATIPISSTNGDIEFITNSILRARIPNSGVPELDVFGDVDITGQYLVNGVPIAGANFVDLEVPTGLINGVNVTYTLTGTPLAGSLHLYLNGVIQEVGAGNDYTISGLTITYGAAPKTGFKLLASYRT